MELAPVKQAFGSPGGKTKLAPRIVGMIPPHRIYVEPFAGGAAVYFKKGASPEEVLNDKDAEIAFAFKFLRDMTEEDYKWLRKQNWVITEHQFKKLKSQAPSSDRERFYRFYYLKKGSFGRGGQTVNVGAIGGRIGIDRLLGVQERLKNAKVHNTTALKIIDKYDSPSTLFYLDPPYPGRELGLAGDTPFNQYDTNDLKELVSKLQHIKGKFALSLGTEHQKYLPVSWRVKRLKLRQGMARGGREWNKSFRYEIVAGNYNLDKPESVRIPQGLMTRVQPRRMGKQRLYRKTRRGYVPPTVSLARMAG